jgi:hypothetical protein
LRDHTPNAKVPGVVFAGTTYREISACKSNSEAARSSVKPMLVPRVNLCRLPTVPDCLHHRRNHAIGQSFQGQSSPIGTADECLYLGAVAPQ